MREIFEITGVVDDETLISKIKNLVKEIQSEVPEGKKIKFDSFPYFPDWKTLPDVYVPGFVTEARNWIHFWECGGGDYSTTENVRYASGNSPKEWAMSAYDKIAGYCKTEKEATGLIIALTNEVLRTCNEKISEIWGLFDENENLISVFDSQEEAESEKTSKKESVNNPPLKPSRVLKWGLAKASSVD